MPALFQVEGKDCVKIEMRIVMHRGVRPDGTKFSYPDYQYLNKDGKYRKLRFGKEVGNVPQTNCFIYVPTDKISSESELNAKYPAKWVHEIAKTEAIMGSAVPLEYSAIKEKRDPLADL